VDEPGQLVAREERTLQIGVAGHLQMLRVRENRLDQLLRIALLAQDRRAVLGVLVERRMDLVVEVVQQRRGGPELLVAAEFPRIVADGGLHRQRMTQECLALRITVEGLPSQVPSDLHNTEYDSPLVSTTLVADALMESFVIEGGIPLGGRVSAAGNKNGALPILAATLLATEPVVLSNVPRIRDVETMLALLADVGADVDWLGRNEVRIDSANASKFELDPELCSRIRASFLLAGPLLARFGRASVPPPGGDVIGRRRLDPHIHALAELGVEIELNGRFDMQTSGLQGRRIFLDEASVMATENAIMAAAVARGETVIGNAACEPHVQDLCRFLCSLGASIEGIGSNVLRIRGVQQLSGGEWRIAPEHIEVASFIGLAAVTGGDVTVEDVDIDDLVSILPVFARLGVHVELGDSSVRVPRGQELKIEDDLGDQIPKIEDGPWPAFPADLTSIALAVATQAEGTVLIFEKMFENRLFFVDKLVSMGARIILCDPHRAVVTGPAKLYGQRMASPDIRAGMAMLIAGLCAEGVSTIGNVGEIDRGYERIDERLRALGARIERVENA
jgi:UDP-N-acetylglucosamine 1-carboxyvinyltransferase